MGRNITVLYASCYHYSKKIDSSLLINKIVSTKVILDLGDVSDLSQIISISSLALPCYGEEK
jgi:hypothetical protein